jgi:hypothetical protein
MRDGMWANGLETVVAMTARAEGSTPISMNWI